MDKKIVDLKQRKDNLYVEEQLENLGLDKDMAKEYDSEIFKETSMGIMKDFFKEREEVYLKISKFIANEFKSPKESYLFWSVMSEHFQQLIMPDIDFFGELFLKIANQEEAKEANDLLEYWTSVADEFERFQFANMKEYLKEGMEER